MPPLITAPLLWSGEQENRAPGKQSPGHLVLQRGAAGAPLGDPFARRQVGEREQPARGAAPADPLYPSKTLRGSEILQPMRKTIRAGNSANGSQLLGFHSLGSCNAIVSPCSAVAREISKPDNTWISNAKRKISFRGFFMHHKEAPEATRHSDRLWCWQLASQRDAGSDQQQPPHGFPGCSLLLPHCTTANWGKRETKEHPAPALMETNLLPSPAKNSSFSGSLPQNGTSPVLILVMPEKTGDKRSLQVSHTFGCLERCGN